MHVAFDHFRYSENFATDRIGENVRVQSLSQSRSLSKFENPRVVNDARANIAALQRDDPDPPAPPEKMIRGPFPRGATMVRVIGKPFAPSVAAAELVIAYAESRASSAACITAVAADNGGISSVGVLGRMIAAES